MNTQSIDNSSLKSWPFVEARKVINRIGGKIPEKGYVLFETGYGPSGLPHIGTFGEVLRTTMVRRAFEYLTAGEIPTKLIAFSDDMDGLRKVPSNVPNQDLLTQHLHKPLTQVPDPFEEYASFGEHNNNRLQQFLQRFGFQHDFYSATTCYKSGLFDETLLKVLEKYDEIMAVMLPTLGAERQASYSPFLPLCPRTGKVLQVALTKKDLSTGTISYIDTETQQEITLPVTGGNCKLQWKVDWAMRWAALGVDYEMSGKDLIDSVKLSTKICRILGKTPPENLTYELFLDDKGQKISKSKGNGLSLEQWLTYAPEESLSLYMFHAPQRAKKLYFDVIPKAVDEYLTFLEKFPAQETATQLDNPVWHIHQSQPPMAEQGVSFALLLNLASVCNAEEKNILWGFISRYQPAASAATHPYLDLLAGYAVRYYQDFIKPTRAYRAPTALEKQALLDLQQTLASLPVAAHTQADVIQTEVFSVGKRHGYENTMKEWFAALYEILLGQSQGPRFGSFIALYGVQETIALLTEKTA